MVESGFVILVVAVGPRTLSSIKGSSLPLAMSGLYTMTQAWSDAVAWVFACTSEFGLGMAQRNTLLLEGFCNRSIKPYLVRFRRAPA